MAEHQSILLGFVLDFMNRDASPLNEFNVKNWCPSLNICSIFRCRIGLSAIVWSYFLFDEGVHTGFFHVVGYDKTRWRSRSKDGINWTYFCFQAFRILGNVLFGTLAVLRTFAKWLIKYLMFLLQWVFLVNLTGYMVSKLMIKFPRLSPLCCIYVLLLNLAYRSQMRCSISYFDISPVQRKPQIFVLAGFQETSLLLWFRKWKIRAQIYKNVPLSSWWIKW